MRVNSQDINAIYHIKRKVMKAKAHGMTAVSFKNSDSRFFKREKQAYQYLIEHESELEELLVEINTDRVIIHFP